MRDKRVVLITCEGATHQPGIFRSLLVPHRSDYTNKVLEILRHDWEGGVHGGGFPKSNPTLDSDEMRFYYWPTMQKKAMYANLPFTCGSYQIIDAFVCLGERFGFKALQVFVEVCKSDMGGERLWANVYYVADSEVPVGTIKVTELYPEECTEEDLVCSSHSGHASKLH